MNLFNFIPGFRTGVSWKGIIASLYYVISIYFFIHTWGMLVFLLSAPFAFFYFIDIISTNPIGYLGPYNEYIFIISTILLIISAIGVFNSFFNIRLKNKERKVKNKEYSIFSNSLNEILKVHFLYVGQADAILVQQSGENLLIDTGYWINGKYIVKYLKERGIKELNYIIITHPHPDHIGGLPIILKTIPVKNVIISKKHIFPIKRNHKVNEATLKFLEDANINIIHPKPGKEYSIGNGTLRIIAPNNNRYERVNNYSIVVKLIYGKTSYLFTGDAEVYSEYEMVEEGYELKSDVLKVSHHGSCTSTSRKFLNVVFPKAAVISVGYNSFYGQPDKCVLDRLKNLGVDLYRTDKQGTIVSISDGEKIFFNVDSCPYPETKVFHTSVRKKYRVLNGSKGVKGIDHIK